MPLSIVSHKAFVQIVLPMMKAGNNIGKIEDNLSFCFVFIKITI